jgi:hypothetical protein
VTLPLVLVLLISTLMLALVTFLFALVIAAPAVAAERTFVFSPADLARMVDEFNGEAIANSAAFGSKVKIHGSDVRFFGRSCSSLTGTSGRAASRVRVLDGANRAALATRTPNFALAAALQSMGAAAWAPPAVARTHQPSWVAEPPAEGALAFATAGFTTGDPTGTIGAANAVDATPTFLVGVDVVNGAADPTALVLALTTELPPTRPGKMPKRSDCFLVGAAYPTDVQALVDLVATTALSDETKSRLDNILNDALGWIANDRPARAARAARHFALEVARRSGSEIPADAAEKMVIRALQVIDALGL